MDKKWYENLTGMAKIYGKRIYKGIMTIDEVPDEWRETVRAAMPVFGM